MKLARLTAHPRSLTAMVFLALIAFAVGLMATQKALKTGLFAHKKDGALALACTPSAQSDKVYFVSCGGTF
jgi:hypothetical protein